jgi:hypothetical protein
MLRIQHSTPAAATVALLVLLLSGCDQLRSTEPPPTYESATVGVAREIAGTQATPAATPTSAPATSK